ncbi:mCG17620, partial [Mus musculus]
DCLSAPPSASALSRQEDSTSQEARQGWESLSVARCSPPAPIALCIGAQFSRTNRLAQQRQRQLAQLDFGAGCKLPALSTQRKVTGRPLLPALFPTAGPLPRVKKGEVKGMQT